MTGTTVYKPQEDARPHARWYPRSPVPVETAAAAALAAEAMTVGLVHDGGDDGIPWVGSNMNEPLTSRAGIGAIARQLAAITYDLRDDPLAQVVAATLHSGLARLPHSDLDGDPVARVANAPEATLIRPDRSFNQGPCLVH